MARAAEVSGAPAAAPALQRDIRELDVLLGRTLARQEGPELRDLVDRVRAQIGSDPEAAGAILAGVDGATAIRLVRAFTAYFHLANVVEQVHRGRELSGRPSWLAETLDRVAA